MMSDYLSRAQWILTSLVAILLALVGGFVFLVRAGQTMNAGGDEPVVAKLGEFESASTVRAPLTAQNAYVDALPVAHSWNRDARLWKAEASWPTGSNLQEPPEAWVLTFYSAEKQASVGVIVMNEEAKLLQVREVSTPPPFVRVEEWLLDSPDAYELVYANGGEAFLTIFPQHTLTLTLYLEHPLRWQATIINEGPLGHSTMRQMLTLQLSAHDGRLILTPVEGDVNG